MPLLNTRKVKDTLFGMLYPPLTLSGSVVLFLVDMGQVLRVLLSPFYGWNKSTYDVAKHLDVVYDFTKIVTFLVPRYTFFGIAFLLVSFAIGDALYCAKLFKAGDISKIGPIKLLRFLVTLVVTTLFSSIMKWLLIPIECLASHEKSLSSYIRDDDAPCTPWRFPEVVATGPMLVVVVVYVAFAFTATFFSVCTNPLAFAPNVQATGRIEALFLTTKVLATFLVFLSEYVTPVATTAVLSMLNVLVLWRHLLVLPFHHHATNLLRGGVYSCICWLSLSSLAVAVVGTNGLLTSDVFQTMQWMLVGGLPVAFTAGIWLAHSRRGTLLLSLDRLRGEFESFQAQGAASSQGVLPRDPDSDPPGPRREARAPDSDPPGPRREARAPRSAYANFFDPSWERKRAFSSGQHAHTLARTLLMQRNEGNLHFLQYIVSRALEEHSDSEVLQIFHISLLRFVFRNTTDAAIEEKRLKGTHKALTLDHEYILYAVERKATQDYAASNMGNGNYNAINLMEFDSGMQTARAAHGNCVAEMRKFWGAVSSKRKKAAFETMVDGCVSRLVAFNRAQQKAEAEYHALLDKYPQSVQLLRTYAAFCDTVNNDVKHADTLRKQALALEGDEPETGSDPDQQGQRDGDGRDADAMSAATSDHENFRLQTLRAFSQWSEFIWGHEWAQLTTMNRRVRLLCLALLATSLGGFLVLQFWLFRSIAKRDVLLIDQTGLLRAWCISSSFLLRSQYLLAFAGNDKGAREVGAKVAGLAEKLQAQHWSNYEIIRTAKVRDYYLSPSREIMVPSPLEWAPEMLTFWAFGSDWTRRMDRASQATADQFADRTDWALPALPEPLMNVQMINENVFRAAIPAFENIVSLYVEEMQGLWGLTQNVVILTTSVTAVLQLAIGWIVVRGVQRTIQRMQHMDLACVLAMQLPVVTSKKLADFYKQVEAGMRGDEDEDEERKHLVDDGVDGRVGFLAGLGNKAASFRRPAEPTHPDTAGPGPAAECGDSGDPVALLPLTPVPDSFRAAVVSCLRREWPIWVRTSVHMAAMVVCVALSVLYTAYPTRKMHQLVSLAPTINQAGRRRFLTRSCVHLCRELVLDDGLTRMSRVDTASALSFYLHELRVSNDAVRLGGDLGIPVGADYRNAEHNAIMYGKGCPWRTPPDDCTTPERPDAASNGLYHLSLSFFDAVESVLIRYGPPPSQYTDAFRRNPRYDANNLTWFESVHTSAERTSLLAQDPELVFILNNFAGDLFDGYHLLVQVFNRELDDIVTGAMKDNETIFAVYVVCMFAGFYAVLFRNAVHEASRETVKARAFVARIPSYTLSQLEIDTVAAIFSGARAENPA